MRPGTHRRSAHWPGRVESDAIYIICPSNGGAPATPTVRILAGMRRALIPAALWRRNGRSVVFVCGRPQRLAADIAGYPDGIGRVRRRLDAASPRTIRM